MGKEVDLRRKEQLQMPFGTAQQRLRKLILFDLVVRLSLNICYKCNERIDSATELSIEHKRPWENVSADLFWDMSNIAFSHHQKCNRPHTYPGPKGKISPKRIATDENKSWCSKHKKFLPSQNFRKNITIWNKLHRHCRDCEKHEKYDRRRSAKSNFISSESSLESG